MNIMDIFIGWLLGFKFWYFGISVNAYDFYRAYNEAITMVVYFENN